MNYTEQGREGLYSLFERLSGSINASENIVAIGLAMAGVGRKNIRQRALEDLALVIPQILPRVSLYLFHDGESALWSALGKGCGIVVSAGTGSIAFGACSHAGGIPALSNLYSRNEHFKMIYYDSPTVENPEEIIPEPHNTVAEGNLHIPEFYERVKTLAQVVEVDYHIPGCPPEPHQVWNVMAFYVTDHTTHFYALGGPDFIVGPDASPSKRNILGVIKKVGIDIGKQVIACRSRNHNIIKMIGGRGIHPVAGVPGGWSKALTEEERKEIEKAAKGYLVQKDEKNTPLDER